MQNMAHVFLALALVRETFAWWGLGTASGSQVFDEMDGLIPFFAAVLGVPFAMGGAVFWLLARRRARMPTACARAAPTRPPRWVCPSD